MQEPGRGERTRIGLVVAVGEGEGGEFVKERRLRRIDVARRITFEQKPSSTGRLAAAWTRRLSGNCQASKIPGILARGLDF